MTIAELEAILNNLKLNHVKPDYKVAVWLRVLGGLEAMDLAKGMPEIDHECEFVVFKLEVDNEMHP